MLLSSLKHSTQQSAAAPSSSSRPVSSTSKADFGRDLWACGAMKPVLSSSIIRTPCGSAVGCFLRFFFLGSRPAVAILQTLTVLTLHLIHILHLHDCEWEC